MLKSSMTIRHCFQSTCLVNHPSNIYFLKHSYFLNEHHYLLHLTILSQRCPYVTMDIVFFFAVPPLRQSCRQYFIVSFWFPHIAFLHVIGWLFFDIKCLWVSLVCPIHILLSLTLYCQQLFLALSHSSMFVLM